MTDEGTPEEPGSLSGEVEPHGAGEWLTQDQAAARLGIKPKAVYRRYKRGHLTAQKAPHATHLVYWLPTREPSSPPEEQHEEEEPRSLAVPESGERALAMIEGAVGRAVSPLNQTIKEQQERIEELIRENERLRAEKEQREEQRERRSWWWWLTRE